VLDELRSRLDEPSARGLASAVSRAVREGAVGVGDRLPPIRTVAAELRLSPTTVSAAWSLLSRTGTISTDGRRGTTIADRQRTGSPRYRRALGRGGEYGGDFSVDLSTGVPDPALLPELGPALDALTGAVAAPGSYLDAPVVPELADVLIADWPYPVDDIAVVDGAMDGLELVTRALLAVGDRVAVEHPAFPPVLDLLEARGAAVVGIPVDEAGMSVEALRAAGRVSAVYLQPRAQNPTGVSLTPHRAERLAEIIAGTNAIVVEDDSAGAVAATDAISLGTWLPDRTVHVRSFAKSHGPDLRVAAMSAPPDIAGQVTRLRQLGQGWTSRLLQRLLLALLTDQSSVRAVARARAAYARRRELMVAALAEAGLAVGGNDGLNIWVPVADETATVVRLASQGIGVAPGAPFGVLPGQAPHVRVTTGLLADEPDGLTREIARAIAEAARGSVRILV
jgi:DNA-binding transcriptional MocR family regulator